MAIKKKVAKAKPAAKAAKKPVAKSKYKPAKAPAKKTAKAPVKTGKSNKKQVAKPVKKSVKKTVAKKVVKPVKKVVKKVAAKHPVKKVAVRKVISKKAVVKKVVAKKIPSKVVKPVGKKTLSAKAKKQDLSKTKAKAKPIVKAPVAKTISKAVKSAPIIVRPAPIVIRPIAATPLPQTKNMKVENTPIGDTRSRYSDAELKEFKELVVNKLADARTELINLNATVINANENGTDDTGASFKMLEDGSDSLAKEESAQLAIRQKKFVEQLEAALQRIENKTYGICRVTGKLIPKERLRAVPHTTQSMEAKLKQYRD